MRIALVTGANKGIGLAVAEGLAGLGVKVLIGARDPDKGAAAAKGIHSAEPITLDVTDPATIETAATEIGEKHGRLDILVNNAGISGDRSAQRPGAVDLQRVREIFETNLFGVIAVTEAMLPLLRRSAGGRIVNVSSGTSSMGWNTDATHYLSRLPGTTGYPVSKAALNMLTIQYAKALAAEGILVNAIAPGACATDFIQGMPIEIDRTAAEGAEIAVRLATLGYGCPSGGFFDDDGAVPW